MLQIIRQNYDPISVYSVTYNTEAGTFSCRFKLEEKLETEEKFTFDIINSSFYRFINIENIQKNLQNVLEHIFIDNLEKTKIIIDFTLLDFNNDKSEFLFSSIVHGLSFLILKSGVGIKDILCAFSDSNVEIIYYLHSNKIAFLNKRDIDSDLHGCITEIFVCVEKAIKSGSLLKKIYLESL